MKVVEREKSTKVRNKSKFIPGLILFISIFVSLILLTLLGIHFTQKYIHNSDSVTALYDKWEIKDYQSVYDIAGRILEKKPLQNTARTLKAYSAFYLAVSQTENSESQKFLDECINNLRIALQNCKDNTRGQIEYMLGKAYFFKNSISSYNFYADLCIKYLTMAQNHFYHEDDISEYLGLSYAALGDTQKSISSFTESLLVRETDVLLLSIAEQYYNSGAANVAKQYLVRVNEMSENEDILLRSHILLGNLFLDEENYDEARKEFETILQKNENSADAHYGLGVLYEKQNDLVKARSEWRKCLRLQVNHPGAAKKMAENNLK